MTEPGQARSPLELGALIALAVFGVAGVLGVIAVIDADHVVSAFGMGFGIALLVFLAGSTTACALACLRRGRVQILALAGIVAAGVATDMLVLTIWQQINSAAYAKVAGIAFVWSVFALVLLGLTLAVGAPAALGRSLYLAAATAAIAAGAISTWLIATTGENEVVVTEGGGLESVPLSLLGEDELLRALGVALVLLATLWFATLAASRLEPAPAADA